MGLDLTNTQKVRTKYVEKRLWIKKRKTLEKCWELVEIPVKAKGSFRDGKTRDRDSVRSGARGVRGLLAII